jgi:hypothetical protein
VKRRAVSRIRHCGAAAEELNFNIDGKISNSKNGVRRTLSRPQYL